MTLSDPQPVVPDRRFAADRVLFFGIGAQKCGSTWLHDYLSHHPQVKVPGVTKELHYWSRLRGEGVHWSPAARPLMGAGDALKRAGMRLLKGADGRRRAAEWAALERCLRRRDPAHTDYADVLFAGADQARAVGEITPAYALLSEATLSEMAALGPNVRFVYQMRDPVDRAVSAARMNLSLSTGTVSASALTQTLRRALEEGDPDMILARSRYEVTMAKMDRVAGRDGCGYFFYETFFDAREIARLTAFLGVQAMPADTEKRVFEGSGRSVDATAETKEALRAALDETYRAVRARFGTLVPDAWRV